MKLCQMLNRYLKHKKLMNRLLGKCSDDLDVRSMSLDWALSLSKALADFKNNIFSVTCFHTYRL